VRGVGGALPAGGFGRGFAPMPPPAGAPPAMSTQNFPPPQGITIFMRFRLHWQGLCLLGFDLLSSS
jgi:hypothetical protein